MADDHETTAGGADAPGSGAPADPADPADPAAEGDTTARPVPEGGGLSRRGLIGTAAGAVVAAAASAPLAGAVGTAGAAARGAGEDRPQTPAGRRGRRPGSSGVTLRWLGNNSWEISFGGSTLLIDPWLTRFHTGTYAPEGADPETPVTVDPDTIDRHVTRADTIMITHGHYDHIPDVPHIAWATGATVLGTETHLNLLRALEAPEEQLSQVEGGESIQFDGYSIDVLRSAHSLLGEHRRLTFGGTRPAAPPPRPLVIRDLVEGGSLAYLVRVGDFSLLSLGSSNYVARELEGLRPDLVLIQPGGSTVVDYVAGLMEVLGHPPIVVPTHWDDFDHPLTEPARDWGGLEPLRRAVREASPRTDFVVVDHLEAYRP